MATDSKPRFVQYCPKDLLDEVDLLDESEDLIYRRVIDHIFKSNDRLPDDDKKVASLLKIGAVRWRKAKQILVNEHKLLDVMDGRITSHRCQEELQRVSALIRQKSVAGKASAEARQFAAQSDPGSEPRSEHETTIENGSDFSTNSLKHNETASTAVGSAVASAVPTNHKPLNYNNNQTREMVDDKPAMPVTKPPLMDASVFALIRALTGAVIDEWGPERGGFARHYPDATDQVVAGRFLEFGATLGISNEQSVTVLQSHFRKKCAQFHAASGEPPTALKWFNKSALTALQNFAKEVNTAVPDHRNGTANRNGHHAQSSLVRQPWEDISGNFARNRKFAEAKRISAVAAAEGNDAANILARQMEAAALGNRRAA